MRIGIQIHRSADWLGEELVRIADEALSAHEERKFPLAVVKSGAFLEGILKGLLRTWGFEADSGQTLGPLIGALRKTEKAPGEFLERLNEANVIRNRGPHQKSSPLNQVTEGDSLQILNILALVVNWMRENVPGKAGSQPVPDLLPVFLSVGSPHRLEQEQFLQHLRSDLRGMGVELLTLTSANYSSLKPIDQITDLMKSCRGALVVGLERVHAYTVFVREKSDQEKVFPDQFIPTAWNQIEGAIASAMQLPLLILRENKLFREGVFEAENHRHRIRDFDIASESKGLSSDLQDFLAGWVDFIRSTPSKPRPE